MQGTFRQSCHLISDFWSIVDEENFSRNSPKASKKYRFDDGIDPQHL